MVLQLEHPSFQKKKKASTFVESVRNSACSSNQRVKDEHKDQVISSRKKEKWISAGIY